MTKRSLSLSFFSLALVLSFFSGYTKEAFTLGQLWTRARSIFIKNENTSPKQTTEQTSANPATQLAPVVQAAAANLPANLPPPPPGLLPSIPQDNLPPALRQQQTAAMNRAADLGSLGSTLNSITPTASGATVDRLKEREEFLNLQDKRLEELKAQAEERARQIPVPVEEPEVTVETEEAEADDADIDDAEDTADGEIDEVSDLEDPIPSSLQTPPQLQRLD